MRSLPKRAAPLWDGLVEPDADVSHLLAGLVAGEVGASLSCYADLRYFRVQTVSMASGSHLLVDLLFIRSRTPCPSQY
jgi:hypothetical protein